MSKANGQLWLIATPYGQLFGKVQSTMPEGMSPDDPGCYQVTIAEPLVTDGVNAGPYVSEQVTIRFGNDCLLVTHIKPDNKLAKQHEQIIQDVRLKNTGLIMPGRKA